MSAMQLGMIGLGRMGGNIVRRLAAHGHGALVYDRSQEAVDALAPGQGSIDQTTRPKGADSRPVRGYMHCGPSGAGHFVKMVHNGIEYGLMQAYGEGFDILKNANSPNVPEEHRFTFNVADIAEVWRRGSVGAAWLLDLTAI